MVLTQVPGPTRPLDLGPVQPRAREAWLFHRYRELGDLRARDELYRRHSALARHVARRFRRDGDGLEDITQVACLAVLKAIDRFEPERGLKFASYAVPTILGEIKRHLRDTSWALKVPRDLHDLAMRLPPATRRLEGALGRAPTIGEIAEEVGSDTEAVLDAMQALGAHTAVSLDQPARGQDSDSTTAILELIAEDDQELEHAENRALMDGLLGTLPERDRRLLELRFADDLTQAEIGRHLGISQMHVSRRLRQALARLSESAESARASESAVA